MTRESITFRTTYQRPKLGVTLALLALPFALLFAVPVAAHLSGAAGVIAFGTFIASIVGAGVGLRRSSRDVPVEARIDREGVHLGAELIPRESIRNAYYVPQTNNASAHLALYGDGRKLIANLAVTDYEQADRVLVALGLGATQHTAQFAAVAPFKSASGMALLLLMLGGIGLFSASLPLQMTWLGVIGMAAASLAPILLVTATVHVGADGLLLTHRLGNHFGGGCGKKILMSIAPITSLTR